MRRNTVVGCLVTVILLVLWTISQSGGTVILNEIVSCNHSTVYDNAGKFNDYIELYNPAPHSVDISGWHLSDTKKNLNRFTFPTGTKINAKSYFLVWGGKDSGRALQKDKHFYIDFSIKNGEKIYLSDKEGKVINKIKIPKNMACDTAYSRIPFIGKWAERKPTPEKQNPLYKEKKEKILPDIMVKFSKESGLYDEPFKLEMKAPNGFDIYYTLDATRPTKKSLKYKGPILIKDASENPNKYSMIDSISYSRKYVPSFKIDKATIVRAIAVRRSDGAVSKIKNTSYFIGFQNKKGYRNIPIISIITDPENLFGYEKGIYVLGKVFDMNGRKKQTVSDWPKKSHSNFTVEGRHFSHNVQIDFIDNQHIENIVGKLKINGNTSRHSRQKSFILFDAKSTNTINTLPEIQLKSFSETQRMLEPIVYRATKDRNLLPIKPELVHLFLDGEYWGMYTLYERITLDFIKKNTSLSRIDLIDLTVNAKRYGNATFNLHLSPNDIYQKIKEKIDIPSLIDFIIINLYISNIDSCDLRTWNLAKWRSREHPDTNKWHWILHDVDTFEFKKDQNPFQTQERCNLISKDEIPLLLQFPEFKKQFVISFQDIANYTFNAEKMEKLLDEFLERYGDAFIKHYQRFGDEWNPKENFSKDNLFRYFQTVRNFYNQRFDYLMPRMKEYFKLSGNLTPIEKKSSSINGGIVLLNTLKLQGDEQYTGKYYSDYDVSLDVQTFPGYQFKGWLVDGKFTNTQKLDLKLTHPRTIEAVWEQNNKEGKNE